MHAARLPPARFPAGTRTEDDVIRAFLRAAALAALTSISLASACDRESPTDDAPAAAAPPVDTALAAGDARAVNHPEEIYFDLTAFTWYREGRPLMHEGRAYMPQADPAPVDAELEEAGTYEGVRYYVAEDAREPVYTIYVPVYYRYWQRFTAPPGR